VRYIAVGLVLALVVMMAPAMAGTNDFKMNGSLYAAAFIQNTIGNLELAHSFLAALYAVNSTDNNHNLFQNMWGLIYGGVLVSGWNNLVTAEVFKAIANESVVNRNNNPAIYDARMNISEGIAYLVGNYSVVFGDADGSSGIAYLLHEQVEALSNRSIKVNTSEYGQIALVDAYAHTIATTIYDNVKFAVELFRAIDEALS